MRPHPLLIIALVGALLGFGFAGFSTYDYAQHLDRRVHDVHCSFTPGLGGEGGSTGCKETLRSPYSSVFRGWIWGGIPVSLPGMSVFAFLLFFGADLLFARRQNDPRATGFYALGALVPAIASVVMAYISFGILGAACKLCIGTYVASGLVLIGAGGLWIRAWSGGGMEAPPPEPGPGEEPAWAGGGGEELEESSTQEGGALAEETPGPGSELQARKSPSPEMESGETIAYSKLLGFFALGVLFVAVPAGAYVGAAPDHSEFIGTCGTLDEPPPEKLVVEMGPQRGVPALEIFDPLCPQCRSFETHFAATGLDEEMARRAVLFPLDDECNWMLDQSLHPGACAVSEAILCAEGGRSRSVVEWAFEHQEKIRRVAKGEGGSAREMIAAQFPELESCVGSPQVKSQLNQSLRWAVENKIKVLTPQLYVDGVRVCDADTDIGLKYALTKMLEMQRRGTLESRAGDEESGDEDEEGGS